MRDVDTWSVVLHVCDVILSWSLVGEVIYRFIVVSPLFKVVFQWICPISAPMAILSDVIKSEEEIRGVSSRLFFWLGPEGVDLDNLL